MKTRNIFFALLVFLTGTAIGQEDFRQMAPEAGPAPKIELGTYEAFTLDNGLRVIVVENHKLPRVSFQLLVDRPPLVEKKYAGTADMAGQLMRNGTTSRTKAEIDETIDFIGASLSTNSGGMYASSLTKHTEQLLEIASDVLLNPTFPEEEFEKLKRQTLSALAQAKEDPNSIASNVAQVLRYGKNHPYGELTTEETIENITPDRLQAFYKTYFKPNISYLAIVGDIEPAKAKMLAEQYFGKWEKGDILIQGFPDAKRPDTRQVDVVDKTGAVQSVLRVTYPVELKPGSDDAIAASLMNTLLGGYFGSRINQNLRETNAFTYGANTSLSSDPYDGYFSVSSSVRNEVTDSAITQILYELNRLRDEKVPEDELQLVKNVRTGSFARSLESPQTIANFALDIARYDLPEDYYATYLQKMNALTVDDIQRVAKTYILPDNAHVLVVGDKDDVSENLAQFDADGELTYYDAFGNEIEMSDVAVPQDITAEKIIQNYVEALGGKDKLLSVKAQKTVMTANTQMGAMQMTMTQKAPNKFYQKVEAGGMTVVETKFDGKKAMVSQMGQKQTIDDEASLEQMQMQAKMFPEANWDDLGYTAELKGVEKVNGQDTYKLVVSTSSGSTYTEFFNTENFLKLRTVTTQEAQGQTMTVTNDYADYEAVDGIMVPYTITTSGAMPFPLKLEVSEVVFNLQIEESVFAVE